MKTAVLSCLLAGACLCLFPEANCAERAPKGAGEAINAKGGGLSYWAYFPEGYDSQRKRKWPALIVVSPIGGDRSMLVVYKEGADRNRWMLLFMKDEPGEGAVYAFNSLLKDALNRFPIDRERCYTSGFSGGARFALSAANAEPDTIRGVIACGAAYGAGNRENAYYYGIAGTNCFNRGEMAKVFYPPGDQDLAAAKEAVEKLMVRNREDGTKRFSTYKYNIAAKDHCMLRFFPGNHEWAPPDIIADAMTWMNAKYFKDAASPDPETVKERDAFCAELERLVAENLKTNPCRSFEFATLLSEIPGNKERAAKYLEVLGAMLEVRKNAEAHKDLEAFAVKYLRGRSLVAGKDGMPAESPDISKERLAQAKSLCQKYRGTYMSEIFEWIGEDEGKYQLPKGAKRKTYQCPAKTQEIIVP